jgi:hypothetical protein
MMIITRPSPFTIPMTNSLSIYGICANLSRSKPPSDKDWPRMQQILNDWMNAPSDDIVWFKDRIHVPQECQIGLQTSDRTHSIPAIVSIRIDGSNLPITLKIRMAHYMRATIPNG